MHKKPISIIFILALSLFLFLPTLAHSAPNTQYNVDRNVPLGGSGGGGTYGVSPQTGGLTLSETDLTLPGRGDLDLAITRTYSSTLANVYNMGIIQAGGSYETHRTQSTHLDKKYGLGVGWGLGFPSIEINSDIIPLTGRYQYYLHLGQGSVFEIDFSQPYGLRYYGLGDLDLK